MYCKVRAVVIYLSLPTFPLLLAPHFLHKILRRPHHVKSVAFPLVGNQKCSRVSDSISQGRDGEGSQVFFHWVQGFPVFEKVSGDVRENIILWLSSNMGPFSLAAFMIRVLSAKFSSFIITTLGRADCCGPAPLDMLASLALQSLWARSISRGPVKVSAPSTFRSHPSRNTHMSVPSFPSGMPTRRRLDRQLRFSRSSILNASSLIVAFMAMLPASSDAMSSWLVESLSSAAVTRSVIAFTSAVSACIAFKSPSNLNTKSSLNA